MCLFLSGKVNVFTFTFENFMYLELQTEGGTSTLKVS